MSAAPRGRSGSASGIIATSRLSGQATGAALVALCFGLAPQAGPQLALALAAGFAGVASVVSFSRMLASRAVD
jgi:DHA2 family multidrug resistance protein-like MFS transporter